MNVPAQIVILMMLSFNSDFFYSLELIKIGQYTKKKKLQEDALLCSGQMLQM